jgi:uncharacterized membrane protein
MVVHFPIALLFAAIFVDVLSIFYKRLNWIKYSAIMLYGIGTVAAIIAYLSGRQAADTVVLPPLANPVLNHHSDLALMTMLFFVLYSIIRGLTVWKVEQRYLLISVITLIFSLPGLYLIFETSEHGAELVYRYGVGVQKTEIGEAGKVEKIGDARKNSQSSIIDEQNGSWRWDTAAGDENDLVNDFHWLIGNGDSIEMQMTKPMPSSGYLKIMLDNQELFVNRGKKLKSVQANLYVNLNDFEGTMRLAHHMRDKMNYDYVALESGKMQLGRLSEGKIKIMDEKSLNHGRKVPQI